MTGPDATDEGLPRSYRLRRPAEFRWVFEQARRIGSRSFTLLVRSNDCGHARLGMAVSRRNLPRAVARNRVKRAIRESFRQHRDRLPAVDIVILTRPPVAELDRSGIRREIDRLFSRLTRGTNDAGHHRPGRGGGE